MNEHIGTKVYPGCKICKYSGEKLGYGLYIRQQYVYASIIGHVHQQSNIFTIINNFPAKKIGISVGDIVYGQVLKVKEQQCLLQLLQINQISCLAFGGKHIEATIKKENVREKMIDSVVMIDSFRPKDIVKAKVLSLGDSVRSVYLTTASEDLGVLVAQHEQTGRLMLPYDWSSMVDVENSLKENRKVCKPQM